MCKRIFKSDLFLAGVWVYVLLDLEASMSLVLPKSTESLDMKALTEDWPWSLADLPLPSRSSRVGAEGAASSAACTPEDPTARAGCR